MSMFLFRPAASLSGISIGFDRYSQKSTFSGDTNGRGVGCSKIMGKYMGEYVGVGVTVGVNVVEETIVEFILSTIVGDDVADEVIFEGVVDDRLSVPGGVGV
jgi:hypothetical protein